MARARGLPLTVILTVNSPGLHCDSCIDPDSFYHNGSCALHYVKELLPRIRELLLFVEKDFDTDNIWESLDEPAPLLETLRVEAMRGAQYQPSHPHGATVYLPKAVFQHQAPKLRSIYVGGVRIHFSSRVLGASLRKLAVVSCQCSQFGAAPDFVQWQLMLHRMPLLEELEIDGSVPFGDDGGTYNTVSLPNLKELRISADVDAFVGHIMHLNLPSSTAIFLNYKPKPSAAPSEELLAQLRNAISKLFKNISPERITYRGLDPDEPEELVSCHIWAKPTSQQDGKPAPPLSINSLAVPDRPPRFVIQSESKYRMEALAPVIVAALDVSSVHTVDIGDFSMGNRWAPILQGAVNVQVLRAHGTAAFGVPTILGRTDTNSVQVDPTDKFYWMGFVADETSVEEHGDHPNTHSPAAVEDVDMTEPNSEGAKSPHADPAVSGRKAIPLFPNLTTLEFVDLDLQVPVGGYPPPCPHASMTLLMFFQAHKAKYGLSIEAIHKGIRMRQAKGAAAITSVRFYGCCCADLAYLEPLAETVPDVYWDGVRVSSASIAEST